MGRRRMRRKLPGGGLGGWEIRSAFGKAPVAACFGRFMSNQQFTLDLRCRYGNRAWKSDREGIRTGNCVRNAQPGPMPQSPASTRLRDGCPPFPAIASIPERLRGPRSLSWLPLRWFPAPAPFDPNCPACTLWTHPYLMNFQSLEYPAAIHDGIVLGLAGSVPAEGLTELALVAGSGTWKGIVARGFVKAQAESASRRSSARYGPAAGRIRRRGRPMEALTANDAAQRHHRAGFRTAKADGPGFPHLTVLHWRSAGCRSSDQEIGAHGGGRGSVGTGGSSMPPCLTRMGGACGRAFRFA